MSINLIKSKSAIFIAAAVMGVLILMAAFTIGPARMLFDGKSWSEEELAMLQSLWIGSLQPLSPDPSNIYADDVRSAELGQKIFFDARFSINGEVACGTCHLPDQLFTDTTPLAHGVGTTNRRTMTIIGTAYSPWLFWDGRKDSLWAQALGPMENPVEHGGNRTMYAHLIAQYYRSAYESIFGPLPDLSQLPAHAGPVEDERARAAWEAMSEPDRQAVTQIYVNIGKAIAAYERLLVPGPSRFDAYVEALISDDQENTKNVLSEDEIAGLRLFIGAANCTQCHNGPLFTDNHFHNTGIPAVASLPEDTGRSKGAQDVLADEFNCLSTYSDADPEECAELRFMIAEGHELLRQFKPPSLRNVAERGPFMHAGQFETLEAVLDHYNKAPQAPAGHSELEELNLTNEELNQIIAFLKSLSAPQAVEAKWLSPPGIPLDRR